MRDVKPFEATTELSLVDLNGLACDYSKSITVKEDAAANELFESTGDKRERFAGAKYQALLHSIDNHVFHINRMVHD